MTQVSPAPSAKKVYAIMDKFSGLFVANWRSQTLDELVYAELHLDTRAARRSRTYMLQSLDRYPYFSVYDTAKSAQMGGRRYTQYALDPLHQNAGFYQLPHQMWPNPVEFVIVELDVSNPVILKDKK